MPIVSMPEPNSSQGEPCLPYELIVAVFSLLPSIKLIDIVTSGKNVDMILWAREILLTREDEAAIEFQDRLFSGFLKKTSISKFYWPDNCQKTILSNSNLNLNQKMQRLMVRAMLNNETESKHFVIGSDSIEPLKRMVFESNENFTTAKKYLALLIPRINYKTVRELAKKIPHLEVQDYFFDFVDPLCKRLNDEDLAEFILNFGKKSIDFCPDDDARTKTILFSCINRLPREKAFSLFIPAFYNWGNASKRLLDIDLMVEKCLANVLGKLLLHGTNEQLVKVVPFLKFHLINGRQIFRYLAVRCLTALLPRLVIQPGDFESINLEVYKTTEDRCEPTNHAVWQYLNYFSKIFSTDSFIPTVDCKIHHDKEEFYQFFLFSYKKHPKKYISAIISDITSEITTNTFRSRGQKLIKSFNTLEQFIPHIDYSVLENSIIEVLNYFKTSPKEYKKEVFPYFEHFFLCLAEKGEDEIVCSLTQALLANTPNFWGFKVLNVLTSRANDDMKEKIKEHCLRFLSLPDREEISIIDAFKLLAQFIPSFDKEAPKYLERVLNLTFPDYNFIYPFIKKWQDHYGLDSVLVFMKSYSKPLCAYFNWRLEEKLAGPEEQEQLLAIILKMRTSTYNYDHIEMLEYLSNLLQRQKNFPDYFFLQLDYLAVQLESTLRESRYSALTGYEVLLKHKKISPMSLLPSYIKNFVQSVNRIKPDLWFEKKILQFFVESELNFSEYDLEKILSAIIIKSAYNIPNASAEIIQFIKKILPELQKYSGLAIKKLPKLLNKGQEFTTALDPIIWQFLKQIEPDLSEDEGIILLDILNNRYINAPEWKSLWVNLKVKTNSFLIDELVKDISTMSENATGELYKLWGFLEHSERLAKLLVDTSSFIQLLTTLITHKSLLIGERSLKILTFLFPKMLSDQKELFFAPLCSNLNSPFETIRERSLELVIQYIDYKDLPLINEKNCSPEAYMAQLIQQIARHENVANKEWKFITNICQFFETVKNILTQVVETGFQGLELVISLFVKLQT